MLVEQLNLFAERDPFDELTEHIVKWYEANKAFNDRHGCFTRNFDAWLRDCFSSYCGGNGASMLFGQWTFYDFSPRGLRLTNMKKLIKTESGTEWESIFFPKQKILNAFGIKDDKKDEEMNDDIKEG